MTSAGDPRPLPFPALIPQWDVGARVRAFVTTRAGGFSAGPFASLNLGDGCGDDPGAVRRNRELLGRALPSPVRWLRQVHGAVVHDADSPAAGSPPADAAVTTLTGVPIAVLTADCLPVLLAERSGRAVGIAHAGWRGLAAGVIENTVTAMRERAGGGIEIAAWLGPAIGPAAFEVGDDVVDAFVARDPAAGCVFVPGRVPGKWWADLCRFARLRLSALGVESVGGGGYCTASDPVRFYSYRRDRSTGRMAALIWLASR